MSHLRWVDRSFEFTLTPDWHPVVIDRLRDSPFRLSRKLRQVAPEILTHRPGEAWSIQEHAGHLVDLDELHYGRLDDYLAGVPVLRAADMKNPKTWRASHNDRILQDLIREFETVRGRFVARLEGWDPEGWERRAQHPRLGTPMRVIDMAWFAAEHDDYHLARMSELLRGARVEDESTERWSNRPD